MGDVRRASRVSADVDIITSILSQRASITSLRSFRCDNRINTILESALADDECSVLSDSNSDSMQVQKVNEVIEMYEQRQNGLDEAVINGLNKRELVHLCSYFA